LTTARSGWRRTSPRGSAPVRPRGQTLIGQRVFAATEEAVETAPVGSIELKGFGRPVVAYEVRPVAPATCLDPGAVRLAEPRHPS
jgi:class 3 adenylate cyclase